MRSVILTAAVLAAWPAAAPAEETATNHVDQLVTRLGSGAYRDRESASHELDGLGAAALDALRKAAGSADPETRRRAAELVERIGNRLTAARILTPTTIEFKYENQPLDHAIADLNRRTGAVISLHDANPAKFRGRTITAATPGPIPLWDAIELFCRKADLHEWDGYSRVGGLVNQQQTPQVINGGFQGQVIVRSGRVRQNGPTPNSIVLLDGPGPKLPVCRSGAVQIRIPPPGTPIDGLAPVAADEVAVPLQISAEPKLHWQGTVDIRIDRAVDDRGRSLTVVPAAREAVSDEVEPIFLNGAVMFGPVRRGGPVGIRVRRGEPPAPMIKELSGAIAGQVRVSEPLAVADAPLKMAGQTIRGGAGVMVKITTASRADDGDVTMSAEVHLPPEVQIAQQAAGQAGMMVGGAMMIQGGVVIRQGAMGPGGQMPAAPAGTTEYQGLSLEDAKGRRFTVRRGMVEMNRFAQDGSVFQFTAHFKPAEAGQEPARLVFTASKPVTIEIPFAVKDVPLP
jgi:ABC-type amino acid transport substrate-binding protein